MVGQWKHEIKSQMAATIVSDDTDLSEFKAAACLIRIHILTKLNLLEQDQDSNSISW